MITHCKCELMHQVLELLFDKGFVEVYEEGLVITGIDKIT